MAMKLPAPAWFSRCTRYKMVDNCGRHVLKSRGVTYNVPVEILFENEKYLFAKTKGYTGWAGIGMTDYYGPCIQVHVKHKPVIADKEEFKCEAYEFEYSKETRKEIFARIAELFGVDLQKEIKENKRKGQPK